MRFILIVLLFIATPFSSIAQLGEKGGVYQEAVYVDAKFMGGGMDKFNEFVNQELDYSKITKPGKIVFTFTVAETGEIKDIRIVDFPYIEMATEIIRVIKKVPHWEPAKLGGKPVSLYVRFPMTFPEKQEPINAQTDKNTTTDKSSDKDLNNNAIMFSGGMNGFVKYFIDNFRAPFVENNLSGKIVIRFVVYEDGSINEIEVLKDLGFGTGKEAIRVMKKCPKWQPTIRNGIPVKQEYRIPIRINVEGEN